MASEPNHGPHDTDEEIARIMEMLVRERLEKDPSSNDRGLVERIMNLGPLGLRLNATQEMVKSMESDYNMKQRSIGGEERQKWEKDKLKASNLPAELVVIGSWRVVSMNEGDLVAKCYFAKRKLVWEMLETTKKLKRKIEILWSQISAIRATLLPNQSGILELELSQPPTFFQEQDPQPRKHTIWNTTNDFTDGQALLHRRHYLRFPPGSLDKHYEKILQADPRLMKLSLQHFPSHPCDYFTDPFRLGFSLDFGSQGSHFSPAVWSSSCTNQPLQAYPQGLSISPDSVIDYLPVDDGSVTGITGSYMFDQNQNQNHQFQFQQQPMITDMSAYVYQNQEYQLPTYNESMRQFCPNQSARMLGSIEAQPINQTDWSYLASSSTSSHQIGSIGGIYPQTVDFVNLQANSDVYQMTNFHTNSNFSYQSFGQDPQMDDCTRDSSNNASMWTAGFHTANV